MKRSVGVSPSKCGAAARQHCQIPGACCKYAPRLQAGPTHASRPRAMGPKSRKGHRAPLFFLPLLGTKGGSSPEAHAPSRRPLKPHGPAGGHEPTLVAGLLGGRGPLWAKRRRGPGPGLAWCPPARAPKDAAGPQRAARVSPGAGASPGRRPLCPSALPGYTSFSRQSPDPQLCARGPAGHATHTDPAAPARCFKLLQTVLKTGRQGAQLRAPPCGRHVLCEISYFSTS